VPGGGERWGDGGAYPKVRVLDGVAVERAGRHFGDGDANAEEHVAHQLIALGLLCNELPDLGFLVELLAHHPPSPATTTTTRRHDIEQEHRKTIKEIISISKQLHTERSILIIIIIIYCRKPNKTQ
jgi:hypothetical protein